MGEDLPYSLGKFSGAFVDGRMEGEGEYTYSDGTIYRGQFKNGEFHGQGRLIFKDMFVEGRWENGKRVEAESRFEFNDGLVYEVEDWNYCTAEDRRFWSEIKDGIKPAGSTQRTNAQVKPVIPPGTFDVGDGYFDPTTHKVHDYASKVELRQPTEEETKWIEAKAPVSSARPAPMAAP